LLPRNRLLRHCSDPLPSTPDFATAIGVLPARHRQRIDPAREYSTLQDRLNRFFRSCRRDCRRHRSQAGAGIVPALAVVVEVMQHLLVLAAQVFVTSRVAVKIAEGTFQPDGQSLVSHEQSSLAAAKTTTLWLRPAVTDIAVRWDGMAKPGFGSRSCATVRDCAWERQLYAGMDWFKSIGDRGRDNHR
jgi:hypothetical protein